MKPSYRYSLLLIFIFSFIFSLFFGSFFLKKVKADNLSTSVTVSITLCGNNIKEAGEECDGSDLDSQTCVTKGYVGGTLICNANCTFNANSCYMGGGGGGGTYVLAEPETTISFNGKAYPNSKVTLLKNGEIIASTVAGNNANFEITLSKIAAGSYVFFLYSEDYQGRRSTPLTFPITVTDGIITRVSGIFLAPTIETDKKEVKKGDNLVIFGQSASQAEVVISVNSSEEKFFKTNADQNGLYSYQLDTSFLDFGEHSTKSKSSVDQIISAYGKIALFTVSDKNIFHDKKAKMRTDLNEDGRVNIIDFSILAYWYKRAEPPAEIDFNRDGKIDLADFSIMAYDWTG